MTPELEKLANLFPFTSKNRPDNLASTLALLESFLPAHARTWALSDPYLSHAASSFRPIKRKELTTVFIPAIYNAAGARAASDSPGTDQSSDAGSLEPNTPHALAALFFLFALGALLDLQLLRTGHA
jgi:hypothetical protein